MKVYGNPLASSKFIGTILTAFAGSIGIIGIALILALSTGFQNYIDKIQEDTLTSYPLTITKETADTTVVDALSLAKEAGNSKAVNVVLIGVMAKNWDIPYEVWTETIRNTVPEKFLEVNLRAFDLGYNS